jgi:two-component system OmpR family sensor kinase
MFNGARSLRSRLIIGSVALTGVAGIAIGAASLIGVRGFLVNQLDEDVTQTAALVRSLASDELQSRINGPGLPVGTVIAITSYGGSQAVYLDRRAHADRIDNDDLEGLRRAVWADNDAAQTVKLGDFGTYRMVSASHSGDEHVIVGLPTSAVDRTVGRIGLFVMGILVAVLGAVAIAPQRTRLAAPQLLLLRPSRLVLARR